MSGHVMPETIAFWNEVRARELPNLPTGWIECGSCNGTGCNFCEDTGQEPTFASAADRDRYFSEGGDRLAGLGPWDFPR